MKNGAASHGFPWGFITALHLPRETCPNKGSLGAVCIKTSCCPWLLPVQGTPIPVLCSRGAPVLALLQRNAGSQGDGKEIRAMQQHREAQAPVPKPGVTPAVEYSLSL